ncbi:MAG TPA: DUF4129 domain-containing protein [Smithella sp.]|nr:DUF4129 domain-containing protein [Smithella sp.]
MKRKNDLTQGKDAIDIIEEATHLLRILPKDAYALYYLGSLPFILAFLYFWADMSRSTFAETYLAESALSLTFLYIWMKCWQAVFSARLRAKLLGEEPPPWTFRRILRLITVQSAIQPTALFVLPVSMVLTLPFAWVYAFYNNVSVTGNGKTGDVKEVYLTALKQANISVAQNHIFIMIYSLFTIFVFINLAIIILICPTVLSTFFGVETSFSRATWGMFNTTLLAVTVSATYLAVNPLVKAVYVLRCFYGDSMKTGEDLHVELSKFSTAAKSILAIIIFLGAMNLCLPFNSVYAAEGAPSQTNDQSVDKTISASELDHSISDVISQREYSWRMPKEKITKKEGDSIIGKLITGMIDSIKYWLKPFKKWLKKIFKWIVDYLSSWTQPSSATTPTYGKWMQAIRMLIYGLIGIAVLILAFVLWHIYKNYLSNSQDLSLKPIISKPDISREDTQADELPADGWFKIAEDLIKQGDLRSALRALYLASLAQLALQKVIIIARFKSNKEYEHELNRKAHDVPELLAAFSGNMHIYEGVWYGMHEVTDDNFRRFKENQTRITAIANKL